MAQSDVSARAHESEIFTVRITVTRISLGGDFMSEPATL